MAIRVRHIILGAACVLTVSAGLLAGRGTHGLLLRSFLSGGRAYILASVPSSSVLSAVSGIQSEDPAERAASWYEMGRLRLADTGLLRDAYEAEQVPFVRSVILYAMKQTSPRFWEQFVSALPDDRKPAKQKDRLVVQSYRL